MGLCNCVFAHINTFSSLSCWYKYTWDIQYIFSLLDCYSNFQMGRMKEVDNMDLKWSMNLFTLLVCRWIPPSLLKYHMFNKNSVYVEILPRAPLESPSVDSALCVPFPTSSTGPRCSTQTPPAKKLSAQTHLQKCLLLRGHRSFSKDSQKCTSPMNLNPDSSKARKWCTKSTCHLSTFS